MRVMTTGLSMDRADKLRAYRTAVKKYYASVESNSKKAQKVKLKEKIKEIKQVNKLIKQHKSEANFQKIKALVNQLHKQKQPVSVGYFSQRSGYFRR